jgi:hypothetical protein
LCRSSRHSRFHTLLFLFRKGGQSCIVFFDTSFLFLDTCTLLFETTFGGTDTLCIILILITCQKSLLWKRDRKHNGLGTKSMTDGSRAAKRMG